MVAFILSIIANINDLCNGFMDGKNASQSKKRISRFQNYSTDSDKTLTWISLSFSLGGFLLYMFSKEKM